MKTKERLERDLRAEGLDNLADLAAKGTFDDFESYLTFPSTALVLALAAAGRPDLEKRAADGEWDGTKEEADDWLRREGAQALLGR